MPERRPARRPPWFPLAVLGLTVALPVALWGLLPGDTSGAWFSSEPDRILELLLGFLALGVVVLVLPPMIRAIRHGRADRRWWVVLSAAAWGSVLVGLTLRVVTAETIGANIGAGLMVWFGLPLAVVGYLVALGFAVYLELRRTD
ncbi:hypothetical protein [Actinophytocola sp.]|uniref:hypothetical protein n=1 Tax=Actinophytocola sp. TaxID=1872138 RepID=UPI003D6A9EF1